MTRQRGALATALATAAAVLSVGTCDGGHSGDTTALVLDDVEVYHTLTADESMQDQEVRFCVCTRVAAGSRNLPLERPESDDFPPPAVQVDLLPLSGDPDLFIAVGSELEDFPSSVKHQFSATTYGPDRLLIPAHVSGRILITVTSRWPSNTTFAIKARTATSLKGVEELAWNMDALDPSAYSRGPLLLVLTITHTNARASPFYSSPLLCLSGAIISCLLRGKFLSPTSHGLVRALRNRCLMYLGSPQGGTAKRCGCSRRGACRTKSIASGAPAMSQILNQRVMTTKLRMWTSNWASFFSWCSSLLCVPFDPKRSRPLIFSPAKGRGGYSLDSCFSAHTRGSN
eukprot:m.87646 g.87646  ORF g.87646 m.87646 type:complete len:343 (+) comp11575_c0_seq1:60-1088(+)